LAVRKFRGTINECGIDNGQHAFTALGRENNKRGDYDTALQLIDEAASGAGDIQEEDYTGPKIAAAIYCTSRHRCEAEIESITRE
jgi:hypothetical protein